jgi:hypothetical protein
LEKISIKSLFCFAEEDPSRGSEDSKTECNVNCFDFSFFSVSLMDVMGGKITIDLKELHSNRKRKKHMYTGKELERH